MLPRNQYFYTAFAKKKKFIYWYYTFLDALKKLLRIFFFENGYFIREQSVQEIYTN